jgi:hypothetical protein
VSIIKKGPSRSCRFACVAFGVYRYIFSRVLNQGFVNHACSTRDSPYKIFLNFLNRSKGSQRALHGGESFVARVNGYYSILNAYNAGREAKESS